MKKRFIYIFLVIITLFTVDKVYAKEIETSKIENSTYVIGKYMLTRTGNDEYDGILTTKIIMLASKTIEANDVNSMVIYYKNARGKWVDALTGDPVTMPEKINISYTDLTYSDIYGDVNLDGVLDAKDITILRKYISGKYTISSDILENINVTGDVNQDGVVNDDDVVLLAYSVSNNVALPIKNYKTYSIIYNLDGGEYTDDAHENRDYLIEYDGRVGKEKILNNPTKEGYVFIGWTGSNGNTPELEVMLPTYPTTNLEYTANYTMLGDIDKNGVFNLVDLLELERYLSGKYTISSDILTTIKYLGDANQDGLINNDDVTLMSYAYAEKVTLPIKNYKTYLITYNLDGGEYTDDADENRDYIIEYDGRVGKEKILNNPIKEGYTFIGWTGSNGNTPELEVMLPTYPTSNLEYTANWIKNYTIKATKVDNYSPDVTLQVLDNGESISIERIEYTDGTLLCKADNMTVSSSDIEGESSFVVVLTDGTKVKATLQ